MDTINEKEKYSFQYERATFLMERTYSLTIGSAQNRIGNRL